MDLKANHTAPVLTDSASVNKSGLGMHTGLLPLSPPGGAFSQNLLLTIPRKKTGILDDVRACGWLDAMKSSSPPHKKIIKDVNNVHAASDEVAYRNWLVILSPHRFTCGRSLAKCLDDSFLCHLCELVFSFLFPFTTFWPFLSFIFLLFFFSFFLLPSQAKNA